MKRFSLFLLALAVAALLAPDARAQRGPRGFGRGGGGGGLGLLRQRSVQDELNLSADQVKQAEDAMEKMRESMADFRDLSREERQERFAEMRKSIQQGLAKILNESQLKRLKQIELQRGGPGVFADPEVSQALGLSEKQKGDIEQIQDEIRGKIREVFQSAAGDRDEIRKQMEAVQKSAREKIHELLSAEQQSKWKDLLGEPFTGEITRFRGRGRRGSAPPESQGSNASPAREIFQLASFKPDDDDDDDEGEDEDADDDDDDEKSKARKSHGKKGKHKGGKAGAKHHGRHGHGHHQHARGDHPSKHGRHHGHHGAFGKRHGGGPNAEAWACIARAMSQHHGWHGGRPSFGSNWQGRFHGHPGAFAHHHFGPHGGFGPAWHHGWHGRHGWHGGGMAAAWRFHPHGEHGPHGSAFTMHHRYHGHGPAHFASHHGAGHHAGFAPWRMHMRPHEGDAPHGPPRFDWHPRGEHDRPHGPPPPRDERHSEAPGPPDEHVAGDAGPRNDEAMERLARLERSLDLLAQQIEELRQSLRR